MKVVSKVYFTENVAIISFEKAPAQIGFLTNLFDRVAQAGINVDMISQTAPKGMHYAISFTVSEENVTKILAMITQMKMEHIDLMPLVSTGNVKISLYGAEMPNHAGVAADVFHRLCEKGIDVLLITTSDVDISLVVSSANADLAYQTLEAAYLG